MVVLGQRGGIGVAKASSLPSSSLANPLSCTPCPANPLMARTSSQHHTLPLSLPQQELTPAETHLPGSFDAGLLECPHCLTPCILAGRQMPAPLPPQTQQSSVHHLKASPPNPIQHSGWQPLGFMGVAYQDYGFLDTRSVPSSLVQSSPVQCADLLKP